MFDNILSGIGDFLGGAVDGVSGLFVQPQGTTGTAGSDPLGGIIGTIEYGAGAWQRIQDIFNPPKASNPAQATPTQSQGTYDPNITASDFMFSPNWWLIGIGLALLLLAFFLRK
ncbi:MAG: hypothetical protein WC374_01115 [Phycisphaerae bacterium]|jgi:hypothetical protein